jgi:delta14-sterol reductase
MLEFICGFFAPWAIYALILGLHLVLPARRVAGYVCDPSSGQPLRYRLNGPLVLAAAIGLWVLVGALGILPWDWLYRQRWASLAGACVLGLIFSLAIVLRAPATGRSFLADFFFGRLDNPQFLGKRLDVKMFLYLVGAVMLGINILAFAAHHVLLNPQAVSPGVLLYTGLFFWFIVEYLIFEQVHLYTYDLFAEKIGFKLGWGCLVFYPYFYAVGIWAVAELPPTPLPVWLLALFALMFFSGWVLSRGANLQKFLFKTRPERALLGLLKPRTITDGTRTLLCSGFWGVARHINYLGEILMATGLTLALGWPLALAAWLYPLYYLALLLPRERDDERRCAAKYGELWREYERRVPNRIIPGLY